MKPLTKSALVLLTLLWSSSSFFAQDHPLIKPYAGSTLVKREEKAFDEIDVVAGLDKVKDDWILKHLEGKITAISYETPEGRSILEVFRNYQQALNQGGFQTVYTCNHCGIFYNYLYKPRYCNGRDSSYLLTKLSRREGDVHVALCVDSGGTGMAIVETKPMDTGMVAVAADAKALAGGIDQEGHAAVYGIYFDTAKADLKPESKPALDEVAKLLDTNRTLRLLVIGHTDNVGSFASNLDLSKRRAESVVRELTTKYKIVAGRLSPNGVGSMSPVATNKTDDGRAKNRRVELVEE